MKLCVIILNYFGSADTTACLQSLIGQPLEKICIIDNSGDDLELAMLQAAVAGLANADVIPAGRNLGFAAGVNFALERMLPLDFDGFILLNNDTVLPSGAIGRLTAGAERGSLDLAAPVINCYPEKNRLWSRGNYYNVWTGLLSANKQLVPGGFFYLPGCCLFVRRHVFATAGVLDADFFLYGEDVEFCHRARHAGFQIGTVADSVIYHKTGAASVPNSLFYEFHINRGHLLLTHKLFASTAARGAALCIKMLVFFLRAGMRTVRYKNGNALRGYAAAVWEQLAR